MNGRHADIASAVPADLDSLPRLGGFRLRGMEMTRLETFIDAAFAFAISMLVIAANQVPDNIEELLGAFRHVPAFVASVVVLGIFWRGHWLWSRRYGLEDGVSIFISWAMIVTILIYMYPLKAIFSSMWFLLSSGRVGQSHRHCPNNSDRGPITSPRHLDERCQVRISQYGLFAHQSGNLRRLTRACKDSICF